MIVINKDKNKINSNCNKKLDKKDNTASSLEESIIINVRKNLGKNKTRRSS